jgi:4-carboxymuconolactone decarboxylase
MTNSSAPLDITPLPPQDWPAELRDLLTAALDSHPLLEQHTAAPSAINIVATLAHHPQLAVGFGRLVGVLSFGELPDREREIAILRTAVHARSTYEWSHHYPLAIRAGLSPTDLERIGANPLTDQWSPHEHALLTAVDEIHQHSTISAQTGRHLAKYYQPRQLLELICLVGCYRTLSTILHSCQVPLDSGVDELPLPPAQ